MVTNSTPAPSVLALIAFGSNQGDRQQALVQGLARLAALSEAPMVCSSWWRSAPMDMPADAGEFINGVASIQTRLSPRELLQALQMIEQALGRPVDHARNVSRVLDLDIICYGQLQLCEPDLILPHPRAAQRLFVLKPLEELAPGLVLPGQSAAVSELVRRVEETEPEQALSRLQAAPVLPVPSLPVRGGQSPAG